VSKISSWPQWHADAREQGQRTTVLITADGRSTSSLGLGIAETAGVARSLGLRNAMNLDGGGSTTMWWTAR
jgi:exopolysaccharide biosynthesis protein